jgi:hypothetical protein
MRCKCVPGAVNGTRGGYGHAMRGTVLAVLSAVQCDCEQLCCKSVSEPVHEVSLCVTPGWVPLEHAL